MHDDLADNNGDAITRRQWLQRSGRLAAGVGLGLAGTGILGGRETGLTRAAHAYTGQAAPTAPPANPGPNDTVVIALIGAGGQGRADTRMLMNRPGVRVAAVCDPDTGHMAQAAQEVEKKQGTRPAEIKDFRRILDMKDVDAVVVATPDHWHALPMIMACQAGKDVYCEKPISHNIVEGRQMVNAAQKYNRVIQVNTWQRSTQHFLDAIDYVRSGKLGKINLCRAWKVQDPKAATMGNQNPQTPPAALDYDLWVGPAELIPYQENRCHYNFRWYFNYAGGMTGDWGVHMMDIVLLGMSKSNDLVLPKRVVATGGKLFVDSDDDRTTPDTMIAAYEFPDWVMQWEVHVGGQGPGNGLDGGRDHGSEFIGSEGRVIVDRSGWTIQDKNGKPVEKPESQRPALDGMSRHGQQWLDAIKSRTQPSSDIASMHQTTTVCHLSNLAYLNGGMVLWDPQKEVVRNDRQAMELLPYRRPYRKPWSLPKV